MPISPIATAPSRTLVDARGALGKLSVMPAVRRTVPQAGAAIPPSPVAWLCRRGYLDSLRRPNGERPGKRQQKRDRQDRTCEPEDVAEANVGRRRAEPADSSEDDAGGVGGLRCHDVSVWIDHRRRPGRRG